MTDIPNWEAFMIPTLRVLSDGATRTRRELGPLVAQSMKLTSDQVKETLSSGQFTYKNRMGWGLSFLTNVGALDRPKYGSYVITEPGRQILAQFPHGVRESDIRAMGEDDSSPIRLYVATVKRRSGKNDDEDATESALMMTPTEQVQGGIKRIQDEVAAELLMRLRGKDPGFFEEAVVQLLLAMGYGGANGRGQVTQLTNDGGIDGVIDQDFLGLRRVYIQAKRYGDGNSVGRPEVQSFVGALSGIADSGVFITSSRFSQGALDYAASTPTRIILIDGGRLAELMIRFGVGVQVRETYNIVEIDEDFFA